MEDNRPPIASVSLVKRIQIIGDLSLPTVAKLLEPVAQDARLLRQDEDR